MRTVRGTHQLRLWQSLRLFAVVLAAGTAGMGLTNMLSSIAAAEPAGDVSLVEQPSAEPAAEPERAPLQPGTPQSTTAPELPQSTAALTWTQTGNGLQEDTYEVRLAPTVNPETNELINPTGQTGVVEARYDASTLAEGAYYWQVRSCNPAGCNEWSPLWTVTIDGTAPAAPTAEVASDAYSQIVRLAGSAEPASQVRVTMNDKTCQVTTLEDGTWSCQFEQELEYGVYVASIIAADRAGNTSPLFEMNVAVKELFVAPPITTQELPAILEIVPVDESPENTVFKQPTTSVIDVVNNGSGDPQVISAAVTPLSTDGGIVQSSENGWQVLGLPWFIWLGSIGGILGGVWAFGAPVPRRLGSLLSL